MKKLAVLAMAAGLIVAFSSVALAGSPVIICPPDCLWMQNGQVQPDQWDAYVQQYQGRGAPTGKGQCNCLQPAYPDCRSGFKKVGGFTYENDAMIDKWGDTSMTPGSYVEALMRGCADTEGQLCKKWLVASVCHPES